MATYNYITLSGAQQQLANRLYDPTMVFWAAAELQLYITESLRVWNSLTGFWRGDFTFPTFPGITWYDLINVAGLPNTLRPITVTDQQLYSIIQYHILEPVAWNPWTGVSNQFTPSDLLEAVQRRRNELLSITGCTITYAQQPALAGRITLADTTIDIRRLAYLPNAAFNQPKSVLWPEDTWAEQSFRTRYLQNPAGTPLNYLQSTQPPISFDVDRAPAYSGHYELLTVSVPNTLTTALASLLYIPDDFTDTIKWGALADLLSRESNSKDTPRADYCEKRYRLGCAALASAPALLAMRLGNVPLQIDSVRSGDLYDTSWEGVSAGVPLKCYHAGLNLLALSPVPNSGPYSLTATVVENAPIPSAPTDPVQVAREDFDAILDYAQHIAAFKQGGAEFSRTMPLFQRFMKQATLYNGKLAEMAEYSSIMMELSQLNNEMAPVDTPDAASQAVS